MKGKKNILIAVLALSSVMQATMAVSPVLAEIGRSFPAASTAQIQYIYTAAYMVSIVSVLLSGKLMTRINSRLLSLVGVAVLGAGGLLPLVLHSELWMLYLSSGLIGLGQGAISVISSALIAAHFTGIYKGTVMGFQSAALSIGGVVLSTVSSQLAGHFSWVWSYCSYLLLVPVLAILLVCLPREDPVQTTGGGKTPGRVPGCVWYFVLLTFLTSIATNAFASNISLFLDDTGLGTVSAAGAASSVFLLVGIPAGMLLGKCIRLMGRHLMYLMSLLMAAGFLLAALAQNMVMVYAGAFLIGVGYAVRNPAAITFAANMVVPETAPVAISMNQACSSLGMFCTPIVITPLSRLLGGSSRDSFLVSAVLLVILAALYLFTNPISAQAAAATSGDDEV